MFKHTYNFGNGKIFSARSDKPSVGRCGAESLMKGDNFPVSFCLFHAIPAPAGQCGKTIGIDRYDDGPSGKISGSFVEDPEMDGPFDKVQQVV